MIFFRSKLIIFAPLRLAVQHCATYFMALIVLLGVCLQTNLADDSTKQIDAANQLVAHMIEDVEIILAQDADDRSARTTKITKLFDRYFDLATIAKFSAGPYWRAADAAEQAAYQTAMRDVIIGTVVRNFDQLSGLKFTETGSQAKGPQLVLVNGKFTHKTDKQPPIAVGWRVVMRDGGPPLILDVEIENISMLVTQKQENIAIIRQNAGKFAAVIDAMQQRIASQN